MAVAVGFKRRHEPVVKNVPFLVSTIIINYSRGFFSATGVKIDIIKLKMSKRRNSMTIFRTEVLNVEIAAVDTCLAVTA